MRGRTGGERGKGGIIAVVIFPGKTLVPWREGGDHYF